MKRIILLAFLLFSTLKIVFAQSSIPCAFDIMHSKQMLKDSTYRNNVEQLNTRWSRYSAMLSSALLTSTSAGYVYEIPVVVHIMHTGSAVGTTYNPDSTQIAGMISYLNKSYAAESPFPDTTTGVSGGGVRIPLKFVLAKRTPTGASTNGILRVNASTTLGSTYTTYGMNAATTTGIEVEDLIKLSRWNPMDYYNIYVVHKIDGNDLTSTGGIAGFAYFPGSPQVDGMYVVASQAKTGTTTVSHEFGHAFSLYHTFEGDGTGSTCPSTSSCSTTGDLVCDTEPHIRSASSPGWCPATDSNPCTGGASYNKVQFNIMDYTNCPPNRYTAGQRTRVLNTLDNERTGYKTSLGLEAPLGSVTAATCIPTATSPKNAVGPYIVSFNDINVWSGSASMEDTNYVDHSYTQQTKVKRGSSYTLSVATRTNIQKVRAFIDYNNDGDFGDAGEAVYSHNGTTTTETHIGTITIPTTATTCQYLRMRVVAEFTGSSPSDFACGPLVYGQTEDYAVYVQSDTPTATSPVSYAVGATAYALTATGSNLKWYTAATGGTGSTTAPTPSTASAGTTIYYVSQSGDGSTACESDRKAISVIVTLSTVSPPTVVSPVNYCLGATASALSATLASSTDTLLWYTVATGGVGSKTAPTPSTASVGSTTYYVSEKDMSGTESSRVSIVVNVNAIPAAPTVTSPLNACLGVTASALTATGTGLLWYTTATGGTGSSTAPTPSTASLGTTKYYVSQTVSGCESARDSISVVVNALPSKPTVVSPIDYCQGYPSSALFATGTSLKWYTAATGGTGSATAPTPSTATPGTTNYYVTQTSATTGCESDREIITINIKATPAAPTVTTPINYCVGSTASALTATGTGLLWYTTATGGTGSSTAPTPSTATVGTTNYYVTQTSVTTGCESPRALIVVNVNPIPSAPTVTTPVTYCQGATASALTATGSGLLWYTAATGGTGSSTAPTPSTATAGTTNYYVSQTLIGCESPRTLIAVVVNPLPAAPTVSTPVTYCQGATASALTATGTGLLWYTVATGGTGSSTAPTPSTATAGTTNYYVSQTNATTGCESPRALIAVVVNALPSAPTVTTPVNYCEGATASALTATGTGLLWYTAATGGTGSSTAPTPSTATAGTTNYYVSQTNATTGCESPRALIAVVVNPLPASPTVTTPVTYCQGVTASALSATGTGLKWYTTATGGMGSTTAPTPSTGTVGTTNYYVSQTNATTGCEGPRALIAVVVTSAPAAPTVTTPVNYCVGATASALTATGTGLLWYTTATGGTGSSTAPTPSTATAGTTNYYVSQSGAGCESPRALIAVVVTAIPAAPTVTSPVVLCVGTTASPLTATGTGLLWYTAATGGTGSSTAPTPSTAVLGFELHYVSQSISGCESPRAAIAVTIRAIPSAPTVTSPVTYCVGATATALTATAATASDTLKWYTSATGGVGSTTAPIPSTTTAGTTNYYVSQTISGSTCESVRALIAVVVNPLPAAPTVTTPVTYCVGATASALTATGTGLLWYTTATGGTGSATAPTPSTATAGTTNYYVSQTVTGCEGPRALIAVVVNSLPAAPTVSTPVTYCVGATASALTATGTGLLWYTTATGGTGSSTAPTPSTASAGTTNYYVSQTITGCEGPRALIAVVVNPLPAAPTVTTPVNYCVGATASALSATGTSLLWYTTATGGTGSATAPTPSTATAGTTNYYVSQTNATTGCEGPRALIAVVVNPLPAAPTVTTPVNYCVGATASALTATGTGLLWYTVATGGTGSSTAPTPSTATAGTTNYYVSQTNATTGCEGPRALIAVVVNPLPAAPTVTTPVNYCVGATASALTATGTGLLWYTVATGGTGSSTAPTPSTATAGTTNYYVSQTNGFSCEGPRALIAVVVNPLPAAPTVTTPVTYCQGATASALTATGTGLLWYTAATGGTGSSTAPTPSTATAGTTNYYVSQTNATTGCEGPRALIAVRVIPTRIYVDSSIAITGTGVSWVNPLKTVSEALELAHTVTCDLEIWVRKGTYFPMSSLTAIATSRDSSFRILRNGIKLYGGFAGTESSLTARTVTTNATILSGDIGIPNDSTDNSYHVMTIIAAPIPYIDSNTVVDGFTVKRGNGLGASGTFSINGEPLNRNEGGGLYLIALKEGYRASPRLDSCIFTENAAANGGGVNAQNYKTFSQVKPKFFNCTFSNNRASISGGGMALVGGVTDHISGTFEYCNFNNNQAATYGGGLWIAASTISSFDNHLSFYKCNFNSNSQTGTGGRGGAMFIIGFADPVSIEQCNFSNNLGYRAGALYIGDASSVDIDSSNFIANEASEWAGAITLFTSTVSLTNSLIKNCKAQVAGGIFVNQCDLTLTNDSIDYCTATNYGGGASLKQNDLTMNNIVFLADTANNGGAMTLYDGNTGTITGCKFIENKAGITNGTGGSGGAVWSWNGGNTITFSSSIFYKNVCQTPDGLNARGAAYLSNGTGTNVTDFNNCLFANNNALGTNDDGGAVMLNTGTANFRSSTFSQNTTTSTTKPNANTISTNSGTTIGLTNTIVWGSAANQVNVLGTSTYSYSLIKGLALAAPSLSVDPRFANASNPIGTDGIWFTDDDGLELLPCSPAVNAGLATTPITDIRNRARFGGFTDMGAYEEQTGVLPTVPMTVSPITYCQGATAAVLTATASSATDTLKWYDRTMTLLPAAPTPSTITAGADTFYVSQTNIVGCESAKARILITINSGGTAPTFITPVTYCQDATTASLSATGTGIKWYTTSTGGTATTVAPTPSSTIPRIISYYLTTTSALGCETFPRAVFDVYINPKPDSVKATAMTATAFCVGDSVILNGSTSIFNGFGSTNYLQGSYASGAPLVCDCPNGSVVVGYEGSTGALIDRFRLICKPINRFGVLGATTSVTTYSGTGAGPVTFAPALFSGTGMMVGIKAIGTTWPGPGLYTFLGGVTGYGQNQAYITSLGDNSSSPLTLASMNGWSSSGDYGTVFTPNGTVSSGMFSYSSFFARGVSLRYTPIGAYKYTYSWSSAPTTDTNSSVVIKTTGTYTLTVTNSLGCSATSAPVNVNVAPYPTKPTVVSPVTYCLGATATALTATKSTATDTLVWYTTATGGIASTTAPTPSTATAGTTKYYVSEKNATGCESPRDSISVVVNPLPAAPTVTTPVTYCVGATASALSATATSASDTLYWYTVSTGGTGSTTAPTPSTTSAGTTNYYVSQKNSNGCEGSRALIAVVVNPLPAAPTVTTPVTYCVGATATALTATKTSATDTLYWYTVATGGTGSTVAPTPSTATVGTTNYYVSQRNSFGCEGSRSLIAVEVNPLPTAPTVTTPVTYCQFATASALTATGTSLKWYTVATGGTSSSSLTPSTAVVGSITYYVSQTNSFGCEGPRASIVVTINPLPAAPTVTTPVTYCQFATSSALTATGTNLKWYTVATGGTGSTTAPTPSTATAGTTNYYVSQTNSFGCEGPRALIAVVVNPQPSTPTVTTPVNYCVGATATALTATKTSATDTLYWYTVATGGTGSTVAPTPSTATVGTTNYYVSQRNSFGCEGSRSLIAVVVNPLPAAPTVTTPVSYCQFATASALTATGTSLKWYTVATGGTSSSSLTPSTAVVGSITYYVSQTNSFGCEGPRASIVVTINPLPAAPTVTTPVTYCQFATSSALTATGTNLKWYTVATGGTASTTAPTPSTATAGTFNFYVSQTNSFGCEGPREVIVVVVNPRPATPTVTTPIAYCQGATASALTATGTSLLWYTVATGGTGSSTAPTPSTATVGATSYYVSQTNTFGCESLRSTIVVNINPNPAAPTVLSPLNLCIGSVAIPLTATGTNLKWYTVATGGTASTVAPTPSTAVVKDSNFYVSQTNTFGCEGPRATLVVSVKPLPVVSISSLAVTGFVYCRKDSITLKANSLTATAYQWRFASTTLVGATADTVWAGKTGYWGVTVTDTYGCKQKDSVYVREDTLQIAVLSPTAVRICEEGAALLTCNPGIVSYRFRWQKDALDLTSVPTTSNLASVNLPGVYRLIVTNTVGCVDTTNTSTVSYYPKPIKPVIINSNPILEVATGYIYYQWYRNSAQIVGAISHKYTVLSDGNYHVEVTDENGCLNYSDTVIIKSNSIANKTAVNGTIKLYPNPTTSVINIDAPIEVDVVVTDFVGKKILELRKAKSINLEDYADGTYLIRILDQDGNYLGSEKVIKVTR